MEYSEFLPITLKEMQHLGWTQPDVIIISGDAYVDHPSFGTAIIGRVLESKGLKVAIIPQPNWQDDLRDFKKFGQPRLFFGVTAGNMDSMINRYTANRRLRSDDAYTPGGKSGFRPDYASITYSKILKNLYPDVPVVLGGIEASMRRVTHYDYWSDSVMPPILFDSKADILVYGMGEKPICDLAEVFLKAQSAAEALENLKDIPQIAYVVNSLKDIDKTNCTFLNSHENVLKSKVAFIDNFKIVETESNKHNAKVLIEQVEDKYLIINPHNTLMTTAELDAVYELPFTRMPHPKYKTRGDIPAFNMIRNSVNIHRGCFGGCSFCTISAHQGKFICSRSEESILKEVKQVVGMPYFGGTLSDLGGPSANMYGMGGQNTDLCVKCSKPSCIYPTICNNLVFDHSQLIKLYDDVAKIKGVKNIFIGSGIRYDLFFPKDAAKAKKYKVLDYAKIVIARHTGGRLKVAPEHCSDNVLNLMRKPNFTMFKSFKRFFDKECKDNGYRWQLIPYFISSHPGCDIADMAHLAIETKRMKYCPEQVQSFTPTPMTMSTAMYYTGLNPYTGKKVFSARSLEDKKLQNMFLFWYKPENRIPIIRMLKKTGNEELIKDLY